MGQRWQQGAVVVDSVYNLSGLHRGDKVEAVDGLPVSSPGSGSALSTHHGRVVYTVISGHREMRIRVVLTAYPLGRTVVANIGALLLVAVTLAVGAFVFWNRPHDPAARLLLVLPGLLLEG